jgi:hypothetical protein
VEHLHRSAAADRRGWPVHELEPGREAMVTAPEALAEILLDLA